MSTKSVDILAINETRLDCTISNGQINISGYFIERKNRNSSGGGVALYIRNTINCTRVLHQEDDLEILCIQVSKPKIKPFLVGTWYKPPGSTIETIARFEYILRGLESYNLEVNIIGDVNCDVGASPLDHKTPKLLDICSLYEYNQMIKQLTRITKDTGSTINLFLTNDPQKNSRSGVSDLGISDHSLVYAVRMVSLPKSSPKITQ